jgi:hypothetical protein
MVISLERRASTRRMLAVCAALVLATILAACGKSGMQQAEERGEITLSRSETAVVVENRAGRPALNVRITIDAGDAGLFFAVLPTMEKAERRTIPFQMFRTEDGSLFSAADSTPKEVRLEGKDTLNNDYLVTLPWERGR